VDIYADGVWTTLARWTLDDLDAGVLEGPVTLSLAPYAGQTIQVRFRYYNALSGFPVATSFWGDLYWQIDAVRLATPPGPGDADGDGDVDLDDFVALKQHFGLTDMTQSEGDFDGNGTVDLDDFVILKQNFGTTAASGR